MPTVVEFRTRALLQAAEQAKVTAVASLVDANRAAEAAHAAVVSAARAGGYDDFRISSNSVSAPTRPWSIFPTVYGCIGFEGLVSAFNDAAATATRWQHNVDGLTKVIRSAQDILCQDVKYESPSAAADLNILLSTLSDIQTLMAA